MMNTETMQPLSAPPAEVVRAQQLADNSFATVTALIVDSPEGYQAAAEDLVDLRQRWKDIEAQRVHLKEPYLEGGRRIDAFFKVPLDRLAQAAEALKSTMLVYQRAEDAKVEAARQAQLKREREEREELERQQREAQKREDDARKESERIQREAQEKADAERKRQEAIAAEAAAAGNKEAEAAAQAAAAAAQAEADKEAEAAREAEAAAALEAQQQAAAAQEAMDTADLSPAPLAVVSGAKAGGVATRKTWKVKSVDKAQLVIAAGKAMEAGDDSLLAYLDVNESALNGIAKALKSAARVAGVVFGEVASLATTGRR